MVFLTDEDARCNIWTVIITKSTYRFKLDYNIWGTIYHITPTLFEKVNILYYAAGAIYIYL